MISFQTARFGQTLALVWGALHLTGCVSSVRPVESMTELPTDLPSEIQSKFAVKETTDNAEAVEAVDLGEASLKGSKLKAKPKFNKSKKNKKVETPVAIYPDRRPSKDPIWVGEKLTFTVSFLGLLAGDLILEALPFKNVNHRKVYHIRGHVTSSPVFSLFYRLNDTVETFFDYTGAFSHRFHVQLDESKQSRDQLELHDSEKKQTFYWSRWNHKQNGYSETKEVKETPPFAQDSLSSLYYLRTVPLPAGAVITFPVISEGKPWEAVCTVVRREILDTPAGKKQTVVIQPEMRVDGVIQKKSGDSFLWLTDDDRRIPIRLEAKVRVGTISARLKEQEQGSSPK